MKILTITGTRPELIRLSLIIKKLDLLVDHVLVYTNQNYDYNLSGRFFDEMGIRFPNYYFDQNGGSFGEFLGNALIEFEKIIKKEDPDKILILGDTNSGLLSIIAERYKIPIYHMEAGNRCYDDRVPEEMNRKIIDTLSRYNLPYTENSKQNLLNEGFHKNFVYKTGNPIYEVLEHYKSNIDESTVLSDLNVEFMKYVLVTTHRAENVDNPENLIHIFESLNTISDQMKVVLPIHPRTRQKIKGKVTLSDEIIVTDPLGFFDFVNLEKHAYCVISDSGTVTEETMLFDVPSLIIRESTERQELIENGSSILTGMKYGSIVNSFNLISQLGSTWEKLDDYTDKNVSDKVIKILIGESND